MPPRYTIQTRSKSVPKQPIPALAVTPLPASAPPATVATSGYPDRPTSDKSALSGLHFGRNTGNTYTASKVKGKFVARSPSTMSSLSTASTNTFEVLSDHGDTNTVEEQMTLDLLGLPNDAFDNSPCGDISSSAPPGDASPTKNAPLPPDPIALLARRLAHARPPTPPGTTSGAGSSASDVITVPELGCAQNEDGTLKDEKDILFYNDPDDETPLPPILRSPITTSAGPIPDSTMSPVGTGSPFLMPIASAAPTSAVGNSAPGLSPPDTTSLSTAPTTADAPGAAMLTPATDPPLAPTTTVPPAPPASPPVAPKDVLAPAPPDAPPHAPADAQLPPPTSPADIPLPTSPTPLTGAPPPPPKPSFTKDVHPLPHTACDRHWTDQPGRTIPRAFPPLPQTISLAAANQPTAGVPTAGPGTTQPVPTVQAVPPLGVQQPPVAAAQPPIQQPPVMQAAGQTPNTGAAGTAAAQFIPAAAAIALHAVPLPLFCPVPADVPGLHTPDQVTTFDNVSPTHLSKWNALTGGKLLVYEWNGKPHSLDSTTVEDLKAAIARITGTVPLVGPPVAANPNSCAAPFMYLVRGLSNAATQRLLDGHVWNVVGGQTFFAVPYDTPSPSFLFTLDGLSFTADDGVEVANLVVEVIHGDQTAQTLLALNHDAYPPTADADAMAHFAATVRVTPILLKNAGGRERVGLCPLPKLPGWYTKPAAPSSSNNASSSGNGGSGNGSGGRARGPRNNGNNQSGRNRGRNDHGEDRGPPTTRAPSEGGREFSGGLPLPPATDEGARRSQRIHNRATLPQDQARQHRNAPPVGNAPTETDLPNAPSRRRNQRPNRARAPANRVPTDEELAPAFLNRKRERQQINNPKIG
ncbi:hypothetical protein DFH07DRAFT_779052 [Mycena maculata]|uniref:Uncharacterized protein n=1 Tax=Mycena maculata TaxID=230809 RepID=A0AAD7MYV1_9AGAR|nr:hypothetical protein DFH07DRAFT_779052 [Mycena maculata]